MIVRRAPRLTDHKALWWLVSGPVRVALVLLALIVWISSFISVVGALAAVSARAGARAATNFLRNPHAAAHRSFRRDR